MLSYAFIRFYMLLYAFIGQTVRTPTRDAASLSNRLLPAEAGKKVITLLFCHHFQYSQYRRRCHAMAAEALPEV